MVHHRGMKLRLLFVAVVALVGCERADNSVLTARPGGPYELQLHMEPALPTAGETTQLTFQLRYRTSGKPVRDLQIAHERLLHNFITDLDFASFAHIHHEDFSPLTAIDRDTATVSFPYQFPHAGNFRIVSEFVHRDRGWTKHFDVVVKGTRRDEIAEHDLSRQRLVGDTTATMRVVPEQVIAGFETEIELRLERGGEPVDNLELYLGTELHGAVWREDGKYFGHLHSYTPKVAAIMQLAHDREIAPAARGTRIAEMMVQLMCLESELEFPGPVIPMRYVFPEAGRYHLFLEVAPGGQPRVFPFVLDVLAVNAKQGLARQ